MIEAGVRNSTRAGWSRRAREAPLPNLLVPIDLREGAPTPASLFALSEGRRAAREAGVTVFAVLMCDARPEEEIHRIAGQLGQAGADRVLLCEGKGLDAPPLDVTHGPALQAAVERVPPLLVLFPAGGMGQQLGPPLAVRLGAAFAAAADVEVSESPLPLPDSVGRLCLRRWRRDLSAYRRLDPVEMERPVVAILGAPGPARDAGSSGAVEVQVIPYPTPAAGRIVELASEPDEDASLALAPVLVVVDATVDAAVADKLRAAAPPGVAVVDLRHVAPAALAVNTPRLIVGVHVGVEAGTRLAAPSPRTRVGVVVARSSEAANVGRSDAVWRAEGPAAWDELAAALPGLAAAVGRRA